MKKEYWKQLNQYNSRYWVSNFGKVKSICKNGVETVLKCGITKFGYERVMLRLGKTNKFKNMFVHVLVAQMFIENPSKKPYVNHKNSKRADNHVDNLEWCTRSENTIHGFKYGFMCKKGENTTNKLTEAQVREIFYSTKTTAQLVAIYPVKRGAIMRIRNRQAWSHLDL